MLLANVCENRARRDRRARFTSLMHHLTNDLLRESFLRLQRNAVYGVDGITWREYEECLEVQLTDLHQRVQAGTYRAQPSRRTYIPKPDGRIAITDEYTRECLALAVDRWITADRVLDILTSLFLTRRPASHP